MFVMKFPVYSYRDSKVGFGSPIVETNDQTAVRGFSFAMNNPQGMMNFAPGDYDLYKIGEFDPDKGILYSEDIPVMICSGASVVGD